MKKFASAVVFFLVNAAAQAQAVYFLEEKTAFCYSQEALGKYLHFASRHNINGMNELVLDGRCNFVPDGQVIHLKNYRIDAIGKTKIVEFNINDQKCWTLQALVQSADFGNL